MKKIWKESLVHAIIIPSGVGVKELMLNKQLQNSCMLYNPENTLAIYEDGEKRKLISDVAKGYVTINLPLSLNAGTSIVYGEITPCVSGGRDDGYDFKIVEKKELEH